MTHSELVSLHLLENDKWAVGVDDAIESLIFLCKASSIFGGS